MGEVELIEYPGSIVITSHIVCYGNASNEEIAARIREEIETMWNEPGAVINMNEKSYTVQFRISAEHRNDLPELEVLGNTDPRKNFFRIEEFAKGNISFVDGIGSNTGYFKLENLYKGSTTAAHEYGHTLGLLHPQDLDYRGKGIPGIMYPRGTLVDAIFQYDPGKPAGTTGGTMHPMYRKVLPQDIYDLKLHRLKFKNNRSMLGAFTNVYHWNHADEQQENSDTYSS